MSAINFKDKVAVVTGASSGIGSATAELFAKLGASVLLVGRNQENLTEVAGRCRTQGGEHIQVIADVTSTADTENIVKTCMEKWGRLDILVNNAGILELGTIETTSLDQYDKLMNTNVRSLYHLTMLAAPHLAASKGCVVNVSSVNGIRSFPGVLAYNISKAAVDQMTRCVALELASKQVRVNSVNPGVIVTAVHKRAGLTDEAYDKFLEHSKTTHALGRVGQPNEVAEAIAFLASDNASFITGVSLPVDGGRHAMCPR